MTAKPTRRATDPAQVLSKRVSPGGARAMRRTTIATMTVLTDSWQLGSSTSMETGSSGISKVVIPGATTIKKTGTMKAATGVMKAATWVTKVATGMVT